MTNTETERPAGLHYHVGWNMPGYLPEMAPFTCESFVDARAYLMDELEVHADNRESWSGEHDCDDIPCPTYGDDCPWNVAQDTRVLADELDTLSVKSDEGTGWSGYAGDLAYWIMPCTDDCDIESEDM